MNAVADIPETQIIPDIAALTAPPDRPQITRGQTPWRSRRRARSKPGRRRISSLRPRPSSRVPRWAATIGRFAPYESTDDAFVEADVTPIAPQVAGRVLRVPVSDNQEVRQGAVLFEIDPSDYQTKLDEARSELAAARGKGGPGGRPDVGRPRQGGAGEGECRGRRRRGEACGSRQPQVPRGGKPRRFRQPAGPCGHAGPLLGGPGDRGSQPAAGDGGAAGSRRGRHPDGPAEVLRWEAAVRQAELDLSYTRVVAPVAGFVTHRGIQPGDYVQIGQPQLALVPRQVWIIANFKETQLARMHPGQPVAITVDAYPDLKLKGASTASRRAPAPGSRSFPRERLGKLREGGPARAREDRTRRRAAAQVLGPGMSVVPEVRVR
jgi:membrane fusion protein (multidrug efflux system)